LSWAAAVWAGGMAPNRKFTHAHRASVNVDEVVGGGGSEVGEELDSFEGGNLGDEAGDGSDDGEAAFPVVRWCIDEAGQAGGCAGANGEDVAFEAVHGAINEQFSLRDSFAVHEESFFKERGTGEDDIGLGDEVGDILLGDVFVVRLDFEIGIEAAEGFRGLGVTGFSEPGVGHENLSVEVVGTEWSGMSKDDAPDSGGGEREGERAAESSNAGDEGGGISQDLLCGMAEVGDVGLPGVVVVVVG
jgi:hypothetical protein